MARTALCPILVQRDDQLAILEGALMAAQRGDGGFAVVSGEAGIGKTRLASELAKEAGQLGCAVLWGACSEAELSLPYLPFVEALGNYLDGEDIATVAERLGPARRELAQLFPRLAEEDTSPQPSDTEQAKLRLFEAIVSLLAIPAEDRTLLLVVEDVHWADDSTRELLDHLARRLTGLRALVLVTYRSDELHRRHPFLPTLQSWRRSGLAELIELEPLPEAGVGEMLAAILRVDEVDPELRELMLERTEGNPFVLEEMLKAATEESEARRVADPGRVSIDRLHIPDTVRDTILLRLARFDPEHVSVLEAAAVLGRTFDYGTLVSVSETGDAEVQAALEAAVAQQLVEERAERPSSYRWRHALTQEAIYNDTVTPRRQAIHARAADVLSGRESTAPVDLAHHLLGAGRFAEAVPVCLRSAEEAERKVAFGDAISLLERVLPHVDDRKERALLVSRIGRDHWLNGSSMTGARFLREGIEELEGLGERVEAARFRVVLGRCEWEDSRPEAARREFEAARDVLEIEGPSAALAMAHVRLAGLHAFELDYEGCLRAARTAVEIAERAGADFERVWALGFVGLGLLDSGDVEEGFAVMDECYREARSHEYWQIAANVTWNDIWTRTHSLMGGLEERLARWGPASGSGADSQSPVNRASHALASSYVSKVQGELPSALAQAEFAEEAYERLGSRKMAWRCAVQRAEVLVELGRYEEALEALPGPEARTELQDIVYDSAARVRLRLARGEVAEAAKLGREILAAASTPAIYHETLALGVEALLPAGDLTGAEELLAASRTNKTSAGVAFLAEMEGRVLLARGRPGEAIAPLRRFVVTAEEVGFRLVEIRGRLLLARALAEGDDRDAAVREFQAAAEAADGLGARLVRSEVQSTADALGIELMATAHPGADPPRAPSMPLGERLITSLFVDVRGYTQLSAIAAPGPLAERLDGLFRFAKATIERHHGVVDKFAGDAVMATFNLSGSQVDHGVQALETALTLRDRAALMDLPVGVGIAVGPAVLSRGSSDDNISIRGVATNLAARLQAAAGGHEILLSEEAHRRVRGWLEEHGVATQREELELRGFEGAQVAYRIAAPVREPAAGRRTA